MPALSEKVLWPIVAILIFGVLVGFYIDDRRRLTQQGDNPNKQQASSSEHAGEAAISKEHGAKAAEKSPANTSPSKQATSASATNTTSTGATSMTIDEYLSQSSSERSAELEANVAHHQGFSGSIDEYLSGSKPKATNNMQAKTNSSPTQKAASASSMSMDEYQAKTSSQTSGQSQQTNSGAYHGGIDEYLAKYGDGAQTPMKKQSSDPFVEKEHMGFHGSYEEYAKKYN